MTTDYFKFDSSKPVTHLKFYNGMILCTEKKFTTSVEDENSPTVRLQDKVTDSRQWITCEMCLDGLTDTLHVRRLVKVTKVP